MVNDASEVFERFTADGHGGVRFLSPECYRGGCIVDADYDDDGVVQRVNDTLPSSDSFRRWAGPKFRSYPMPGRDGRLHAYWVLLAAEG
jgi:hypothetical protein